MKAYRLRYLFKQIVPIAVIWLIIGWVFLWTEHALIGDVSNTPQSAIALTFPVFVFASISVALVGALVALVEHLFIQRLFRHYSVLGQLIGKFIFYLLLLELVILAAFVLAASIELGRSVLHAAVWAKYTTFFTSITHLSTLIQLAFSLLVSLFYLQMSAHLGPHTLAHFMLGRYCTPRTEKRLFMFSDMKASTVIAETLGHAQYFDFLKCYYSDLVDAILRFDGEVYQYVGDEIVLTWSYQNPESIQQALDCFTAMKQDLAQQHPRYLKRFGVVPDFRASLHLGDVTTGEIGALKKAIFFTGDVLNTAARMQSQCALYEVDLIVSAIVVKTLAYPTDAFTKLGEVPLKGKQDTVGLYAYAP